MQGFKSLGSDAQRIRNRNPDPSSPNIKAQNAAWRISGVGSHAGIIEGSRLRKPVSRSSGPTTRRPELVRFKCFSL